MTCATSGMRNLHCKLLSDRRYAHCDFSPSASLHFLHQKLRSPFKTAHSHSRFIFELEHFTEIPCWTSLCGRLYCIVFCMPPIVRLAAFRWPKVFPFYPILCDFKGLVDCLGPGTSPKSDSAVGLTHCSNTWSMSGARPCAG